LFLGAFGLGVIHGIHQKEIQERGSQNGENEFWSDPGIKENAKSQDEPIFCLIWNKMVCQQKQWQHVNKESYIGKNHGVK
jgi:hypothetical protein